MWQTVPMALFLATLSQIAPFTLQHSFRALCPCATRPQEDLSLRQVLQEVRSNRKHELHCCPHSLLGFPAHQYDDASFNITWRFRGKEFPWVRKTSSFKKKYCMLETLETEGVLEWDEGVYTCTVTSSNGTTVQRSISLCVNINEDIGQPPVKSYLSPDTNVLKGRRVNFTCTAYLGRLSCLRPENHSIAWRKELDNRTWIPVEQLPHVQINQSENEEGKMSSNLIIKSVEKIHFGRYFCIVRNQHGNLSMNTTLLEGVPEMVRQGKLYQAVLLVMMSAVMVFLVVGAYAWPPCRMTIALYYSKKTSQGSPPEGFQQDLFLVHGDSASSWVWTVLLPMLEDTCGYTCFLPQRDMCGGDLMIEVMLEAVSKSRRVVIVVTPCLLRDPWAAWAIHQAMNAALKKQARILALVLKDPKAERGVRDTSGILRILSLVKRIRVPFSCGWQGDGPLQDPPLKSPKKTVVKAIQITTTSRRTGSKLTVDAGGGGDRSIRSRSKSPKSQKLSASTAVSKEDLEASRRKKKKEEEAEGPFNFKEEEELRSPCSVTPFIKASSRKIPAASDQTSVRKSGCCCWRIPCTRNEEEIFWQTVRFHLGRPAFRCPDAEVYKK